jgi:RNA polymerase sigma-70 factor (ECF subfamily)
MKTKFNKSQIFKKAWYLFKIEVLKDINNRTDEKFSECLRSAWQLAKVSPFISVDELYKMYYSAILHLISNKVKNIELAEDLTSDTFVKAMEKMYLFDSEKSNISTWLHNISKNVIIDYYRKNKLDKHINVSEVTDETGKEIYQFEDKRNNTVEVIENNELSKSIERAMSSLKPKYQKVAELFFIKDQPYSEIAEALELPLNTIKGMIYRIREMLQNELKCVYQRL